MGQRAALWLAGACCTGLACRALSALNMDMPLLWLCLLAFTTLCTHCCHLLAQLLLTTFTSSLVEISGCPITAR